jgi:hypothetical protein
MSLNFSFVQKDPSDCEKRENGAGKMPWRLKYVRFIRRTNWLIIPMYIFMILIPTYNTLISEIPPLEQSEIAKGEFSYKQAGRNGKLIVLKNANEKSFYTCRDSIFGGSHDCFIKNIDDFAGKPATIRWFEQPIYLSFTQRRIIQIIVDEKEIVSREALVKRNNYAKKTIPYYAIGLLILFALIPVYLESQVCRKIEESHKHESHKS